MDGRGRASGPRGELLLSAMTLRSASFADRVPAAAAAGFAGIGLGAADYLDARRTGFSEPDLRAYVDHHGLRVVELEFLRDWWVDADTRGVRLEEDILLHLADLTGAEQINVGLFDDVPAAVVDASFRRLCARAAEHGLRIGLEFMPYSAVRTLERAQEIIAASGAPNAGLVLDAWHWHRAGADLTALAALDGSQVVSVQLNDAAPSALADLRFEGRHRRLLPGEGVIDLDGFLGALRRAGVVAPVAVEVLSDDLDALPPREVCLRAAETARATLSRARGTEPSRGAATTI